ncbi:hypothetical protein EDC96DRAFT_476755 [Choanephora cucurbitarum]|nr:hypothetical protein EDC96DRAFT_476755 [Choanephora cucurbitarum]
MSSAELKDRSNLHPSNQQLDYRINAQDNPMMSEDEEKTGIQPSSDDGNTSASEEFDWEQDDPEDKTDNEETLGKAKKSFTFFFLSRKSSLISWIIFIFLTFASIAVCVVIYVKVKPQTDPTLTSYNLGLWFTFVAFMFCISFATQCAVEFIPWIIKNFAGFLFSRQTEILRARLSYYMALRLYIKLVGIGAWAWGSWAFLRWHIQSPANGQLPPYVATLERVMEILFLLALFLFVEKFILQLIVTSFHKKAYGDRLQKNERALRILDKLKRVKRTMPQDFLLKRIKRNKQRNQQTSQNKMYQADTEHNTDKIKFKPIINTNPGTPVSEEVLSTKQTVTFPPTHSLDTLIPIPPLNERHPDASKVVDEKAMQEDVPLDLEKDRGKDAKKKGYLRNFEKTQQPSRPTNKRMNTGISGLSSNNSSILDAAFFNSWSIKGGYNRLFKESVLHQDPIRQAKVLARDIYHNIMGASPVRHYLIESDLYDFFRTISEAREAFHLFDIDTNGDISKRELRAGCIRIYRERKDLARSMRDMSQVTGTLDNILLVVFACIWAVVVMAVFGVNVATQLTPLWSAFIAASFIFGSSAKDAFESILFVFVTHPFDTGDRILIDSENWTVASVGLMVTTFLKWSGDVIYVKNTVLATKYIINCRRTGNTTEALDIQISYHTPTWKIQALGDHMVKWANNYPKLYTPNSTGVNIINLENLNRITLTFYFEHTNNFQDLGGRWLRHNNFMMELKDELQRLCITYSKPDQPVVHAFPDTEETMSEEAKAQLDRYRESEETLRRRYTTSGAYRNVSSRYQNQADSASSQAGGGSGDGGGDSGVAAAGAATVVFTTGAM